MKDFCDIPEQKYFAIFVISDSRLYEFKKACKLFEDEVPYFSTNSSNNYGIHGDIPKLESTIEEVNNLKSYIGILSTYITEYNKKLTFNMSILHKKCSYFIFNFDFRSRLKYCKIPIFTSSDKAINFLEDLQKCYGNKTSFVEFSDSTGIIERVREELKIVCFSHDEVMALSETQPLLINPYVISFF